MSILPAALIITSTIAVAVLCRRLLAEAENSDLFLPSLLPLFLAVMGIVLVSGLLVLVQTIRVSHRLRGPKRRISAGMRRVRTGDLGFRIHLRRCDSLVEVASEFNKLLDWLNENPPQGVMPWSDVVDMDISHKIDVSDSDSWVHECDSMETVETMETMETCEVAPEK